MEKNLINFILGQKQEVVLDHVTHFILSYSCEVVATRSSPTYTSQKGRQPFLCLLKSGTGVMTMERSIMGLLWGIMGSSAIMSHMYSIYLQSSISSYHRHELNIHLQINNHTHILKIYLQSINTNMYSVYLQSINHQSIVIIHTYLIYMENICMLHSKVNKQTLLLLCLLTSTPKT